MSFGRLGIDYVEVDATLTASSTTEDVTVTGAEPGDHLIITPKEAPTDQITGYIAAANTVTVACEGNESGGTDVTILVIKKQNK